MYTTYVTWIASGNLLYDSGTSRSSLLCDDLEEWDGMGEGGSKERGYREL